MLSEKPRNFSTMLDTLGISSSHLTYHLENLGELVTKLDDGRYKLSTFGKAAVMAMRGVEETPESLQKGQLMLPLKWKSLFAVLMIGIIILAVVSGWQYLVINQLSIEYQRISEDYELLETDFKEISAENEQLLSWGTSPDKVLTFLRDVVHLNMTKYLVNLESNTVEYRSDWDIVEEIYKYSLTYDGSKLDVTLRFRNTDLSTYYLHVIEGSPYYSQSQPNNILDAAKNLLERYQSYSRASHLEAMINILETVDEIRNIETTAGNVKLIISNEVNIEKIQFIYTSNNIGFQAKSVILILDNYGFLQSLSDDWSLFNVGSTEVSISQEEAKNIAIDYAKDYSWTVNGEIISNFTLVEESVSAELWPHSREEPLELIPYWYVIINLDRVYPDRVDRLAVGLWADSGEVSTIHTLSW
jgi:hypothetical protein